MEDLKEKRTETAPPGVSSEAQLPGDRQILRTVRRKAFPNWLDLLAILGIFLLSNLLVGLLVISFFGMQMTGLATFISYVGSFGVTIAFALTLTRQRTGTLGNILHFSFRGFNPAMILWGLILMLAANVVIEPLINLFPAEWYEVIQSQISTGGWATLTAVVVAPICEEVLFRGIIQDSLVRKGGPWSGILIASALFGLIHGIPQQVVAGFFLGIIIGFVYYKTRSLLAAIVLHGINNALATFMTLFEPEEGAAEQSLRELIGNDTTYGIVFAFCALLLLFSLLGVVISIRRGLKREKVQGAEKTPG